MPDIPTSFTDDQMQEIKLAAQRQNLTVDEFVSQATKKLVKNIKDDARKRISNPSSLKVIK